MSPWSWKKKKSKPVKPEPVTATDKPAACGPSLAGLKYTCAEIDAIIEEDKKALAKIPTGSGSYYQHLLHVGIHPSDWSGLEQVLNSVFSPPAPVLTSVVVNQQMAGLVGFNKQILSQSFPPLLPPPATPAKEIPQETVAGPIYGYRRWMVENGLLLSINDRLAWPPGVATRATCTFTLSPHFYLDEGGIRALPSGPPPQKGCSCGYYAWKSVAIARGDVSTQEPGFILGKVALWGRVIDHQDGYRAEYAYPVELYWPLPMADFPVPEDIRLKLETTAKNYGVPLLIGHNLFGERA